MTDSLATGTVLAGGTMYDNVGGTANGAIVAGGGDEIVYAGSGRQQYLGAERRRGDKDSSGTVMARLSVSVASRAYGAPRMTRSSRPAVTKRFMPAAATRHGGLSAVWS